MSEEGRNEEKKPEGAKAEEKSGCKCNVPMRHILVGAGLLFIVALVAAVASENCGSRAVNNESINIYVPDGANGPLPPVAARPLPPDGFDALPPSAPERLDRRAAEAIGEMAANAGRPLPPPPCPGRARFHHEPPCPFAGGWHRGQSVVPPYPLPENGGVMPAVPPHRFGGYGCAIGRFQGMADPQRLKIMIRRNDELLKYAGSRMPIGDVKRLVDDNARMRADILEMTPPKPPFSVKRLMDRDARKPAMESRKTPSMDRARIDGIERKLAIIEKSMKAMDRKLGAIRKEMGSRAQAMPESPARMEMRITPMTPGQLKEIIEKDPMVRDMDNRYLKHGAKDDMTPGAGEEAPADDTFSLEEFIYRLDGKPAE